MAFAVVPIDSLDDPAIADLALYQTLKHPRSHRKVGVFVAEGPKLVTRLLQTQLTIVSILTTERWRDPLASLLKDHSEEITVYIGAPALLEEIVGFTLHQNLMAIARIPAAVTLDDLCMKRRSSLLVAVDGITSAENTGVIVRNCAAMGVDGLLAGETSVDPYLRRSVRNSMGTIFNLPIIHSHDLVGDLHRLRGEFGFRLFVAHPRDGSAPAHEVDFSTPCCVVFGNEENGAREPIVRIAESIMIPMAPTVDSLNVANAAAMILYEIRRQRLVS